MEASCLKAHSAGDLPLWAGGTWQQYVNIAESSLVGILASPVCLIMQAGTAQAKEASVASLMYCLLVHAYQQHGNVFQAVFFLVWG